MEILTPENQHEANTGRSKLNSAMGPPPFLSTAGLQLSMEKLCTVTHLAEIYQIYIYTHTDRNIYIYKTSV